MSKFISTAVVALALTVGITATAGAGEHKREYSDGGKRYCEFKKVVYFKTVIDYKIVKKHFVKYVTEYDEDGCAHKVKKVFCKEIKVPFEKEIPCVKWVKVACYKKVVCYKTVIDYKIVKKHFVKYVTEYDEDGCAHKVKKVFCKEVKVPCKKEVPYFKWVKVDCDC